MDRLYTKNEIYSIIRENEIVFIYFWSNNCGVCEIHKPKLGEILKSYPKVKILELEVEKNLETTSQLNIFTVPAILLFVNGTEILREARYINLSVINEVVKKYYDLLY